MATFRNHDMLLLFLSCILLLHMFVLCTPYASQHDRSPPSSSYDSSSVSCFSPFFARQAEQVAQDFASKCGSIAIASRSPRQHAASAVFYVLFELGRRGRLAHSSVAPNRADSHVHRNIALGIVHIWGPPRHSCMMWRLTVHYRRSVCMHTRAPELATKCLSFVANPHGSVQS